MASITINESSFGATDDQLDRFVARPGTRRQRRRRVLDHIKSPESIPSFPI